MRLLASLAVAGCAIAMPPVAAQGIAPASPSLDRSTGSSGIRVGSMTAHPGIDLSIGYNDNLARQSSNPISSPVVIIAPFIVLEGRRGPHAFDVRYRGETARYPDSPNDNFNNNEFQANVRLAFGIRNDVALRFDLKYGADPRGSTDRPITTSPDRYRDIGGLARYGYGARGAKGRLEFDAEYRQRRYTNNPQAAAVSDFDTGGLGAMFYWRVMPKTRLLLEGRYQNFDYIDPASTLDSDQQLVYIGAQWDATGKTSGFAKFGRSWKNFASPGQENSSTSSWDVAIRWSPKTYSVVDFSTRQSFEESTGIGDSIVNRRAGVTWTHAWNSRLSHSLSYFNIHDNYVGAGTDRKDDTNDIGIKVKYDFRRWARFGAEYAHTNRDSNDSFYRYKRNVYLLTLGASL